ncbi:hypothetical protein AUP68_14416 [Ilyonectria robusta]
MVDNYGAVTENTIFPSPTAAPPEFTETGWADPGGTVSSTDAQPTTTAASPADQGSSPSDLGFREIIAIVVPICTLVFGALGLCFKYSAWKRDRRDSRYIPPTPAQNPQQISVQPDGLPSSRSNAIL